MVSAATLLCFATLCVSFFAAEGLKCYICKQTYFHGIKDFEPECLDEAWEPQPEGEGDEMINSKIQPEECPTDKNYTSCSKSYMANYDVRDGKKQLVTRIVERNCSVVDEDLLGCDYDKGASAWMYTCYCEGDNCNSANIAHISISLLVLFISIALLNF